MWQKMQENDSSNILLKEVSRRAGAEVATRVSKVRGNETLDCIFEQKGHRIVALCTHNGLTAMGLVRGRLSAEDGGRLFRDEFANCDRVTLKVTKTYSENEPYKMEYVSNRKCHTGIDQLYPTKVLHLIRHGESLQNQLMHEMTSDYIKGEGQNSGLRS